jgi:hypothetical protein
MRWSRRAASTAFADHLQSTPQGFELYQRMGYRTVTSMAVFCS